MEINQKNINNILDELNLELKSQDLNRAFTVFGSGSLILLGQISENRTTTDLDIIDPSIDIELMNAAISTAQKIQLNQNWLNSSGDVFSQKLKDGWKQRLKLVYQASNLEVYTLDRMDLILLKLYAYYKRGLNTDLSDLVSLTTDKEEIEVLINTRKDIFDSNKRSEIILKDYLWLLK